MNAALSPQTIVPNVGKLPRSSYHGILVNSMQALDVICILSFDEPVMRRGQNEYTEFKENLHFICHHFKPNGGGPSQKLHYFSFFVGKVGKNTAGVWWEQQQTGLELLASALHISEDIIGIVYNCERNVPFFDWNGFSQVG